MAVEHPDDPDTRERGSSGLRAPVDAPVTPAAPPAASAPDPEGAQPPTPREYVTILGAAAVLGIPAALAAAILMSLIHGVTLLMWTTIPDAFGWTSPAAWYVVAVPAVGGLLVAGSLRLPGHGG